MTIPTHASNEENGAYKVHPLLDPRLPSHSPGIAKMWTTAYRRIKEDPSGEEYLLRAYSFDPGGARETIETLHSYCEDADLYLDDLLRLLPERIAAPLRPLPETRERNDLRQLFLATFEEGNARLRYEAQRKLYLGKLLFDVDHCRSVRDAPQHQARFERVLDEMLWAEARDTDEVEVCCSIRQSANGEEHLKVGVPRRDASRCWKFNVREIPGRENRPAIRVYHYHSRFKKDATPAPALETKAGLFHMPEAPRWPGLGRRSGSIVSKMIRRGIDDPNAIQDVLGAMFIVETRSDAYALERRLVHALGGPFRWRDRVDTLGGDRDHGKLGPQSSSHFRVLKQIVDLLYRDGENEIPHLYPVEIQIYPVNNYLTTLFDSLFASHTSYKRRQFLQELLPILFPPVVFGDEIGRLSAGADDNGYVAETV